jgi:hypothetical protein
MRMSKGLLILMLLIGAVGLTGSVGGQARKGVTFRAESDRIEVLIDGKPAARYHFGAEWLKPFLHEVRASTGTVVTRGYPLTRVAGESRDHFWHHGIWYGHGDINGVDFWREFTGDPKEDAKFKLPIGRFVIKGRPQLKGGMKSGSLTAEFDLLTHEKKAIGTIRQAFSFRREGTATLIDAEITIRADRGIALRMGDTEEGSLGLRFDDAFRQDRGAVITNSSGLKGTENVWGQRAEWVDYTTSINGERVGLTILDHPGNPKHPTYWHARGYGLCGVNPFGEHDFHNDPKRDGSLTIKAGDDLRFRYRVAIHNGQQSLTAWKSDFVK